MRPAMAFAVVLVLHTCTLAQSPTATLSGRVLDPSGAAVVSAAVNATNVNTNLAYHSVTNSEGLYTIVNLPPGPYRVEVAKPGFKALIKPDVILHVQDVIALNFKLSLGAVSESITVQGGAPLVNSESAAVSTVVDRQFAENLPMNGRSFETLIELTPGIVLSPGNANDQGQFNVNGQRGYSNYWMVDGVSANIGVNGSVAAGGAAGTLQGFSAQGGTNGLVSIDALQEFRVQSSTYAPEFGRTPGAQISIVTRSGTNQFHGALFDYFRNDFLDAKPWFSGYINNPPIPKAEERQNDFGGTLGGALLKNRTFFFFSYEGLRLRQPRVALGTVPSLEARQNAVAAMQPFFDAFPKPNGADLGDGTAFFTDSHSDRSSLNATSLRIDHKVSEKLGLFGRYDYSPSDILTFPGSDAASVRAVIHTATVGATWLITGTLLNDLRFNYSRTDSRTSSYTDTVGGAIIPPFSGLLPQAFTLGNSAVSFTLAPITNTLAAGFNSENVQHQINIVDSISLHKGSHSIKVGVDFRRLTPILRSSAYTQSNTFLDMPSAEAGSPLFLSSATSADGFLLFRNLGLYTQDTWQMTRRLTLTYGLRWDVDFAPHTTSGPSLAAITGCCDLATIALAPAGTPVFSTRYNNFAPRLGAAYQLFQRHNWETVLRGGFGVFYDLATSETASLVTSTSGSYPFGSTLNVAGSFPIDPASTVPPPPLASDLAHEIFNAFDPHLRLPYTLQWNAAVEQALGAGTSLSVSYVGAAGRRLTQSEYGAANANISAVVLGLNAGRSDYHSLQTQFQQRLSRGLQMLGSYAWAHSIDTASAASAYLTSNFYAPQFGARSNRGSSDFDVRHALTAALTYTLAAPKTNRIGDAILRGWSVQSIVQAKSAPPVNVDDSVLSFAVSPKPVVDIRPDVIPGVPLYLFGSQYPGGKAINNTIGAVAGGCPDGSQSIGPFCPPPTDPNTRLPQQGNLGRNSLRGFGVTQWDFAIHREFPIREAMKLEFRAELFNVLNHPNFGPPVGDISQSLFGLSTMTLAQALGQTGSSLSPLYQIGGPRSVQLALKLSF
jgi:hypothetical protein